MNGNDKRIKLLRKQLEHARKKHNKITLIYADGREKTFRGYLAAVGALGADVVGYRFENVGFNDHNLLGAILEGGFDLDNVAEDD